MRPRLLTIPLALALGGAVGGCAANGGGKAPSFTGERKQVADVIEQLQSAGSDRKATTICNDLLARQVVDRFKQANVRCLDQMDAALKEADSFDLETRKVEIKGNTATATVRARENKEDRTQTVTLVKQGGDWKITGIGTPAAAPATGTTATQTATTGTTATQTGTTATATSPTRSTPATTSP